MISFSHAYTGTQLNNAGLVADDAGLEIFPAVVGRSYFIESIITRFDKPSGLAFLGGTLAIVDSNSTSIDAGLDLTTTAGVVEKTAVLVAKDKGVFLQHDTSGLTAAYSPKTWTITTPGTLYQVGDVVAVALGLEFIVSSVSVTGGITGLVNLSYIDDATTIGAHVLPVKHAGTAATVTVATENVSFAGYVADITIVSSATGFEVGDQLTDAGSGVVFNVDYVDGDGAVTQISWVSGTLAAVSKLGLSVVAATAPFVVVDLMNPTFIAPGDSLQVLASTHVL